MILFHYTSAKSAQAIAESGLLLPHTSKLLDGTPVVWLTDHMLTNRMTTKTRRFLGLDHDEYGADRTEAEVRVSLIASQIKALPWQIAAIQYPGSYALTEAPIGARPATWWICYEPIAVTEIDFSFPGGDV